MRLGDGGEHSYFCVWFQNTCCRFGCCETLQAQLSRTSLLEHLRTATTVRDLRRAWVAESSSKMICEQELLWIQCCSAKIGRGLRHAWEWCWLVTQDHFIDVRRFSLTSQISYGCSKTQSYKAWSQVCSQTSRVGHRVPPTCAKLIAQTESLHRCATSG